MATNRRDIELLISAKETTGRSFKQVTDNIAALNAKIEEQIRAAERGEGSLQDLRRTQEQLAQAGRDLSAIQGQIDAYTRLTASTDKVEKAATDAAAKLAALKAKVEESGKATAAQENQMQRLEAAVVRTSAAVEKNKQDIASQIAVLERAGVAVNGLDAAQANLVNSARQIGAGLVQTNTAIDGFAINVARARDAEASLAAQAGFERKIAEAQKLGQASRFVQLFGDAINTVKVADNQLAALTGFRAVGAQAAEAANDMSRFVTAGQSMVATSSQVAAGLRAIIDPAGSALQTLKGVEAAIEQADMAAAEGVKNVGLLSDAYNNLSAASAALLRQGGLIDSFRQQEAATAAARQQFAAAQAEVQQLGTAMARAEQPTEQLAASLVKAENNLQAMGRALTQEETKLGDLSRALRAADIDSGNLAAEMGRLEAAATRTGGAMGRINQTLGRGGQATNGFLGLKPNELSNLSFQINDIFVSLASGQNPLIVLIQQGSQIGQLFPGIISSIGRFALAWAPAIAAVGLAGAAIFSLVQDFQRLKQAQKDLATLPTGAGIDAQKFADAQKKLEGMGASAEDAREAMLLLAEEGFQIGALEDYSVAAQQLAERLGIDLVDATNLLVDVQKGGIDAVLDLAEKTNLLTEADLDHADALFKAGDAAAARQYILDKVAERNDQIAKASQSAWTPAVNNLKAAWSSFTGFLRDAFSPVLAFINYQIAGTIGVLTTLTGLLAGKSLGAALMEGDAAKKRFNTPPKPGGGAPRGASDQAIRDRRYMSELDDKELNDRKAITREQRLSLAAQRARRDAQAEGVSKAVEERAVQQAIGVEQRKINEEAERDRKKGAAAAKRGEAAAKRAQRAAEAEQRRRDQAVKQLDQQLRQLDRAASKGGSATLEDRLEAIDEKYQNIAESIKKVRALGIGVDGKGRSLAEVEAEVEATKQRLKDEETIKFYQERAALLSKQREDEVERVSDLQKRGAISTEEAMSRTAEITGRLSPQIVEAAQQALTVARAIAGTNPSPEMVSWIASLEKIVNGEQTNNAVAVIGLEGLDQQSDKLDDLLKQRDTLVDAYRQLGELGIKTPQEVRDASAKAFADQATAIEPVLTKLRGVVEALHNQIDPLTGLPVLTDTAYAAWLAKLDAVNAGLQQTTTYLSTLESETLNNIATAGVNAFSSLAEGVAGFIAGTKSLGDVFKSVGRSILQSLAQITMAIAQAIIKFLILRALEGAAGLPPGTLSGGGGAPKLFGLFHGGGVVGKQGTQVQRRTGMNDNWVGAPMFHEGGGAGLRPDEYKAVLKRGEEVLTEDNPRHINNAGAGGSGGGQGTNLKQVLLLDPEAVPSAMRSRSGQQAVLTIIRANKETIKQALG